MASFKNIFFKLKFKNNFFFFKSTKLKINKIKNQPLNGKF